MMTDRCRQRRRFGSTLRTTSSDHLWIPSICEHIPRIHTRCIMLDTELGQDVLRHCESHHHHAIIDLPCSSSVKCVTKTPFRAPSFDRIHLPSLGSRATAATSIISCFSRCPRRPSIGAEVGLCGVGGWSLGHLFESTDASGSARREMPFTKPSTGIVLTREKERSEGSSAQIRIWPSHEPEAKRSVPRNAASEVIHRAPDNC